MVKEKLNFINEKSTKNLLDTFEEVKTPYVTCPSCGSDRTVRNGHYVRKISFLSGESRLITIQKHLCRKCSSSFKQLPIYLSSKNHFSTISLLKMLIEEGSIKHVSKVFDVSRNTIRRIRNCFGGVLRQLRVLCDEYEINTFEKLYRLYKKKFGEFLLDISTDSDTPSFPVYRIY